MVEGSGQELGHRRRQLAAAAQEATSRRRLRRRSAAAKPDGGRGGGLQDACEVRNRADAGIVGARAAAAAAAAAHRRPVQAVPAEAPARRERRPLPHVVQDLRRQHQACEVRRGERLRLVLKGVEGIWRRSPVPAVVPGRARVPHAVRFDSGAHELDSGGIPRTTPGKTSCGLRSVPPNHDIPDNTR